MYNIGKRRISIHMQEAVEPGSTPVYWLAGYTEFWDQQDRRLIIKEENEPLEMDEPASQSVHDWLQSMLDAMKQDKPHRFF